MTRFIIVGIFSILAVIKYAQAISMGHCAQVAIAKGVPELGIPSHDPLVIPHNLTLHLDHLMMNNFTYQVSKITWTNLPWWKVTKDTVVKNTTSVLDHEGGFWWDNFTFSYDFKYEWGKQKLNGHVEYFYQDVNWDSDWEETQPDAKGARKLNYLHIKQSVKKRSIKTSGFGLLKFVADNVLLALSDVFSELVINKFNLPGRLFSWKINKEWYGNATHYNKLVDWCKAHNVTAEYI